MRGKAEGCGVETKTAAAVRCPPQRPGLAAGRSPGSQAHPLGMLPRSPSHACAQWRWDRSGLAYRCGGSAGIGTCCAPSILRSRTACNTPSPASRFTCVTAGTCGGAQS